MSNKKNNMAAETEAQQPAVAQPTQEAAAPPTEQPVQEQGAPEKEQPEPKVGKTEKAPEKKPTKSGGALTAVGKAACKRHKLSQVWVTNDGQAFANENDAKAHAKNLPNSETIKVTA